jgi:hypothetical protein
MHSFQHRFPDVLVMALKSLHAWCDYHHGHDQTLDSTHEANLNITVWTVHLDDLICWLKMKEAKTVYDVPKFLSYLGMEGMR